MPSRSGRVFVHEGNPELAMVSAAETLPLIRLDDGVKPTANAARRGAEAETADGVVVGDIAVLARVVELAVVSGRAEVVAHAAAHEAEAGAPRRGKKKYSTRVQK